MADTLQDIDLSGYDFLDFGTAYGGSLTHTAAKFGGRGLGIDLDAERVDKARQAGHDVVCGDVLSLPRRPLVRFVSMVEFLEHLPDHDTVFEVITTAAAVATEFLYLRCPSFDDDAYLRAVGLKQYWCDWKTHTCHLLLPELVEMLRRRGMPSVQLRFAHPALDSSHPDILPRGAPQGVHRYRPAHGPKPDVVFPKPLYRNFRIVAPITRETPA